jgi:mobilome CxxCx(11)CxxC protein
LSQDLQSHCADKRFYAFGTAKIFERRAQQLEKQRNWITYLGIVVPLLVGACALAFGTEALPFMVIPAGILGAAQLALSAWSLVAKRDATHSYALGAVQAHTRLFNTWDAMAKRPPAGFADKVTELDAEDQRQEQSDLLQNISTKEKRFAMRSSLYHFGSKCQRCQQTPSSMKPSDCDTCGNF